MNEQSKPTETGDSRIPDFASREEEAEFWDTHDFTEFLDELTPTKVRVAKPLSVKVEVRFEPDTDHEVEAIAREKGLKKSTLIRSWVLERLRKERHAS
ncbi:MAG TPA: CopG family antitoxin [Ktedonobacteraceae bacterium]|nr:CopG family antitoxin [Ktedonobacteraceae bacterium]